MGLLRAWLAALGKLTPLMASVAMAVSSVSVVANAIGLRRYRWKRVVGQEVGELRFNLGPLDRGQPIGLTKVCCFHGS